MTKQLNCGANRPFKPWQMSICSAVAVFLLHAPLAHADGFKPNNNAAAAAANKQLNDRLDRLEQRLGELANRLQSAPVAGGAPGMLNLPAPPGMPPVPVSDDELVLGYERKGTINGSVIVKRDGRVQIMPRAEFERFEAQSKARARLQLTKDAMAAISPAPAGAPPVPGAPPSNSMPAPVAPVASGPQVSPGLSTTPPPGSTPSPAASRAAKVKPTSAMSPASPLNASK